MADATLNAGLPRHPGPVVKLGATEFVLPPMSMKIRRMDETSRQAIASGAQQLDEETVVTQVVLLTLQRNYPDLTVERIEDLASYDELLEVYLTLKEEEARRMAALGERVATGQLAPVAQLPQTS